MLSARPQLRMILHLDSRKAESNKYFSPRRVQSHYLQYVQDNDYEELYCRSNTIAVVFSVQYYSTVPYCTL
jgi:hypothetical protein